MRPLNGRPAIDMMYVKGPDGVWIYVEEEKSEHETDAVFTLAILFLIAMPFASLLYLACMKGWI